MDANRRIAIIVGILFIVGTVAGILSYAFAGPILDAPDYLALASANEGRVITGALFVLLMGFALAMVPVVIFPVLRKYNETLAIGYLVFRGGLETVAYFGTVISWLLLLSLGSEYGKADAATIPALQAMGALLHRADDLPYLVLAFPLGALMFYCALYQSRLIPRWLSAWGLFAIVLNLAAGLFQMFGLTSSSSPLDTLMNLPLLLQEMVMAVWLIAKGFNSPVIGPSPTRG